MTATLRQRSYIESLSRRDPHRLHRALSVSGIEWDGGRPLHDSLTRSQASQLISSYRQTR